MQHDIERRIGGADANVDRRQQLRMRRFFMSLASYAMWYLIALACWHTGLLDVSGRDLALCGLGMAASQAAFFALFRSGFNLRFADPSLTGMQMIAGLGWALLLIAVSREIRGVILTVYMVTLLFGIFEFGRRQFLAVALIAWLGYIAVVIVERAQGLTFFSDGYYIVSVTVLGAVLLWTTAFGSYVSDLRHKLQARNAELEEVLVRMRRLADRDDLTGLFNRRVIMDVLDRLKARADRTHEPFSVCIIDLDNFKAINDAHGHLTGDRVLAEFSAAMAEELRAMDFIARGDPAFGRYGGEEFILLLPGADIDGAHRCAERLRARQEECLRKRDAGPCCTLSAGVAQYARGENIEVLLRRADHALYAAKRAGRNRVTASEQRGE